MIIFNNFKSFSINEWAKFWGSHIPFADHDGVIRASHVEWKADQNGEQKQEHFCTHTVLCCSYSGKWRHGRIKSFQPKLWRLPLLNSPISPYFRPNTRKFGVRVVTQAMSGICIVIILISTAGFAKRARSICRLYPRIQPTTRRNRTRLRRVRRWKSTWAGAAIWMHDRIENVYRNGPWMQGWSWKNKISLYTRSPLAQLGPAVDADHFLVQSHHNEDVGDALRYRQESEHRLEIWFVLWCDTNTILWIPVTGSTLLSWRTDLSNCPDSIPKLSSTPVQSFQAY